MNKKLIKFSVLAATATYLPAIDKILSPLISSSPSWSAVWLAAIGLYNLYLYVEQDKLNEVVEFINENPHKFTEAIINTDYFRSNFLKFLEEYLKQPNKLKREGLKKILLNNLSEEEKGKYEIDRLNNVLSQISLGALKNLLFIKKNFIPLIATDVEEELKNFDHKDVAEEVSRLRDVTKARKNISSYVQKWIYDNYNPNSVNVKQQYKYDDTWDENRKKAFNSEHWLKEHEVSKEINSYWPEYVSLSIMSSITDGVGEFGGGSGTVYKLTDFGETFIDYIETELEQ